jgi:hypothetical protein
MPELKKEERADSQASNLFFINDIKNFNLGGRSRQ